MEFIKINEVGPRDGLQNEKRSIATQTKIEFINALSDSGLKCIETTSFVSPKWIPQLADHREVCLAINKHSDVRYPVLIPNREGMLAAIECGVTDIAVFTAASEEFTARNTHCSITQSFERISEIMELAASHSIHVRGYISCVIACPYAGATQPSLVTNMVHRLIELGCYDVSLGDTIGVGEPKQITKLLKSVLADVDPALITMHFHDTHRRALDNIKASLKMNITSFDSSVGGLGGCPYAEGASGNVSTQAVVRMLAEMGYETGVDVNKLDAAMAILNFNTAVPKENHKPNVENHDGITT